MPFRSFLLLGPYITHSIQVFLGAVGISFPHSLFLYHASIHNSLPVSGKYRVIAAIFYTAIVIGRASSLAPDAQKAKVAASRILQLIRREPDIDGYSTKGWIPVSEDSGGLYI